MQNIQRHLCETIESKPQSARAKPAESAWSPPSNGVIQVEIWFVRLRKYTFLAMVPAQRKSMGYQVVQAAGVASQQNFEFASGMK